MPKLVLTRMKNETVVLTLPGGRRVTVTVVGANRESGSMRLAFDAPSDVAVNRGEVQAEIDAKAKSTTKREGER